MSRLFLTGLNLNRNELLNARIQNLATAPSNPVEGQIYYDTVLSSFRYYDGSAWKDITTSGDIANADIASDAAIALSKLATDPLARANHTGTQLHTTISDFDSGVQANTLDSLAAPAGNVDLNSNKITGLADPTNATDAANKQYVDAARSGLDVKESVRVSTTAADGNIDLTGGTPTTSIDGVSLADGDRVLVKNQSDASENGIYVYASADDSYTRASDANSDAEVTAGLFTFVEEGSDNGDAGFVLSTNGAITLGTTDLAFSQFSGTGQITAGAGLTKDGNILNVVGTADRIIVNADSIDIASTYAGQNSITTLGTITTGTWNGSTIDVANGGTGATTFTSGEYLVGNGTSALSTVTTIPGSDINGDISGNAANVTGTVAIENGGTGATTAAAARTNLGATTKYAASNTELTPSSGVVTWTVSHSLGTSDVTVLVRDVNTGSTVEVDVTITDANTTTLSWVSSSTVAANSYRVVVVG